MSHFIYRGTPCLARTDRSTIFKGVIHFYQGQTCSLHLQGHSMFTKGRHVHYIYRGTTCLTRTDRSSKLTVVTLFAKDKQVHYTYRGTPCLARTDIATIFTGVLHLYQGQTGPLCLQGCSMFNKDRQVHYTYSGYHA